MADMMYGTNDFMNDQGADLYGGPNHSRQRIPALLIGNLTWWTTDLDIINSINSLGCTDVQEVKFFENRNNGQSKGFCLVSFNSEASLPIVTDGLPKKKLYGKEPQVVPYNRHNLGLFEAQTKPRTQINSANGPVPPSAGMIGSIGGVHAGGFQGSPFLGINSFNQATAAGLAAPGVGVAGGPRPPFHPGMMRMPGQMAGQMRTPRPFMRMPHRGDMMMDRGDRPDRDRMMDRDRAIDRGGLDGRGDRGFDSRDRTMDRGSDRDRLMDRERDRDRLDRDRDRGSERDREHRDRSDRDRDLDRDRGGSDRYRSSRDSSRKEGKSSRDKSRDRSSERTRDRSRSRERVRDRSRDKSRERRERRERRY